MTININSLAIIFVGSFAFWNVFNPGTLPLYLFICLFLMMSNFGHVTSTLLSKEYAPVFFLFLTSSFLATPLLAISTQDAINVNHIVSDLFVFGLFVPVSALAYKRIIETGKLDAFFYVQCVFMLTLLLEWTLGTRDIFLNDVLGFHSNRPAGNGLFYRAKGFFPEPGDAAVASLFFCILSLFHTGSRRKRILSLGFFIFSLVITRSATIAAVTFVIFLGYILTNFISFRRFNPKRVFQNVGLVCLLVLLIAQFSILPEILQTVIDKLLFSANSTSASRRGDAYTFFLEFFGNQTFMQMLFGRGTGFISENFEFSALSWLLTLLIEKGLIFLSAFVACLLLMMIAAIYNSDRPLLAIFLMLASGLPLMVQTGYYFPFFGFSIGILVCLARTGERI